MTLEELKSIEDKAKYVVENCDYIEIYEDGRIFNTKTEKFLAQRLTKFGYLTVAIPVYGKNGKRIIQFNLFVHRLVGWKYIPNSDNLSQINHRNHNKTDNRVENLEWCDCRYNSKDRNAYYKSIGIDIYSKGLEIGKKNRVKYIDSIKIKVIDDCGNIFESYNEAAKYYGCFHSSIKNSVNKGYKAVGHHFYKYEE